jgi:hypothetical protein
MRGKLGFPIHICVIAVSEGHGLESCDLSFADLVARELLSPFAPLIADGTLAVREDCPGGSKPNSGYFA